MCFDMHQRALGNLVYNWLKSVGKGINFFNEGSSRWRDPLGTNHVGLPDNIGTKRESSFYQVLHLTNDQKVCDWTVYLAYWFGLHIFTEEWLAVMLQDWSIGPINLGFISLGPSIISSNIIVSGRPNLCMMWSLCISVINIIFIVAPLSTSIYWIGFSNMHTLIYIDSISYPKSFISLWDKIIAKLFFDIKFHEPCLFWTYSSGSCSTHKISRYSPRFMTSPLICDG